jgi:NAD-dependent dihydropyrimidine dehydrogenase PreA subunit
MTHKIDPDVCILCGACEAECPEQAISEVDGAMWIDPEKCTDQAACVEVCPVEAISKAS